MGISVGGATVGTTFDGDIEDALDKILYPFIAPTFSSFAISGAPTQLEVGATFTGGLKTFVWTTTTPENIEPNSISIYGVTGLANDGSEQITIPDVTKTTASTETYTISATNTQGGALSRNFSITWKFKLYYGENASPTLTETDIEALRIGQLATSSSGTYNYLEGGYKWLAYPTTFGLKTTFKDTSTLLNVAMEAPITIAITNSFGITQNYYLHRTTNVLGGSISIAVS